MCNAKQASQDRPLLTSHYQDYVEAGVNPVEAFALMSDPAASAYFDNVLGCGIQRGANCCMAGELLVKHIWYTVRAHQSWHVWLEDFPAALHVCSPKVPRHRTAGHGVLQGLQLHMSENKLTPLLLSKLAAYASGKAESLKAVIKVLPELCQVHPDSPTTTTVCCLTKCACAMHAAP